MMMNVHRAVQCSNFYNIRAIWVNNSIQYLKGNYLIGIFTRITFVILMIIIIFLKLVVMFGGHVMSVEFHICVEAVTIII